MDVIEQYNNNIGILCNEKLDHIHIKAFPAVMTMVICSIAALYFFFRYV